MDVLESFKEIWLVDFEFRAPPGEVQTPVCMVAREFRSGSTFRFWADELATMLNAPFSVGADSLFVAYYASAEFGCFCSLGWPMPVRILDLFAEFRCLSNGLGTPCGASLLGALAYFGIDSIDSAEKDDMRQLAMRGGEHTEAERMALLDYCESDVTSLAVLLPAMLPKIDLPHAMLRGRYTAAAARMEFTGVPIDTETLGVFRENWDAIKSRLTREIDRDYGVFIPVGSAAIDQQSRICSSIYQASGEIGAHPSILASSVDGVYERYPVRETPLSAGELPELGIDSGYETDVPLRFSAARFAELLIRNNIPWPRLESGVLALDDDTFRQMARIYPAVAPLRELRHALGEMRLFQNLAVGTDGRNRCLLSVFQSLTGRNQPSNAKFIFGPSCWLRGLIQPEPGRAIAYVDWSQQEFGIAAALSGDKAMQDAYSSGDPYLTFAKQAGAVPADATKASHKAKRELFKVCALAVQYGMGEKSLARSLDKPEDIARELLRLHRSTYPVFWHWSVSAVNHAMLKGWLQTVFGWRVQVGPRANPRSLANFPVQANGAEMLRLACCLVTERGIQVCAPIHDALLIEADDEEIAATVIETQKAMVEASRIVLDGFALRSDAKIVTHPERYMDPRGERMWKSVIGILASIPDPVQIGSVEDF